MKKTDKIHVNATFKGALQGHRGAIYKLFCLPGSDFLYSAGGDGWIVQWNKEEIADGILVAKDTDAILDVCTIESDRILAGTLQGNILDIKLAEGKTANPRKIEAHKKGAFSIISHGDFVFSAGGDGSVVRWKADHMIKTHSIHLSHGNIRALAFDKLLHKLWVGISSGKILILDPDNLSVLHTFPSQHEKNIFKIVWVDQLAISGGMDAQIRVWNKENYNSILTIPAHWFTVNDLVTDVDRSLLLSASRDKTIRVWSTPDFKLLTTIRGHTHSVNTLYWDKAREVLYSAGDDRQIRKHTLISFQT